MRAMWLGFAAAIVIAIIAGVVMDRMATTAGDLYSAGDTRL